MYSYFMILMICYNFLKTKYFFRKRKKHKKSILWLFWYFNFQTICTPEIKLIIFYNMSTMSSHVAKYHIWHRKGFNRTKKKTNSFYFWKIVWDGLPLFCVTHNTTLNKNDPLKICGIGPKSVAIEPNITDLSISVEFE